MKLSDLDCFVALDWGWNAPACWGWWLCLPDGHYHILREWKHQRVSAHDAGLEVWKRTKALGIRHLRYVVADPAIWQHTGAGHGEATAETLSRAPIRLPMKKGDNDRKNGWQRVHELLQPAPDGAPWLTIDESCTYLRRTIAAAVSDKSDPDDMDTTGDDHGLDMCLIGSTEILTVTGPKRLAEMALSDVVWTRAGWRAVEAVAVTNYAADLRRVTFSDGTVLVGTDNHPVFTPDRGFVRMDALRYGDRIEAWDTTYRGAIAMPVRSGGSLSARFRAAIMFITKTATRATTRWRISSAFLRSSISATTGSSIRLAQSTWTRFDRWRWCGIAPSLAVAGMSATPNGSGRSEFLSGNCARSASANLTTLRDDTALASVRMPVGLRRGVSRAWTMWTGSAECAAGPSVPTTIVTPDVARRAAPHVVDSCRAGIGTVYNLSVQDTPEYFANGILVHNCRYGAMSRPAPSRVSTVKVYSQKSVGHLFQQAREAAAQAVA